MKYVQAWRRSDDPDQRCRTVMTANLPVGEDGEVDYDHWLFNYFAPWISPDIPPHRRAKSGEIRHFIMDSPLTGHSFEVPDGAPVRVDTNDPDQMILLKPTSRTFIFADIDANPYIDAEYERCLMALPERLRSQLRWGKI